MLTAALLVGLIVAGWLVGRSLNAVAATFTQSIPAAAPDQALAESHSALAERFDRLDSKVDACMKAVAEGIDHVERNEKRVRGILTGARNRFASAGYEDPGVEAEITSLPEVDERSSPEEELQPVQEGLELGSWVAVPGMKRS